MIGIGIKNSIDRGVISYPLTLSSLVAWYAQNRGITLNGNNVSQWDDQFSNGRHLIQATATNQPRALLHDGTNYMFLPGTPGNYADTPDSVALSFSPDLDLRCNLALVDWTPGVRDMVIAKWEETGNQRSFLFSVNTNGVLSCNISNDGTANIFADSTVATGFIDGSKHWIRATFDGDNGATGRDFTFYTSTDGVVWTQLGDVVTQAGTLTIFDSTTAVEVGSRDTGTLNPAEGEFYRAQVLDGIDGTLVFDADFTAEVDGTTSFTESSSQAATVTINQSGGIQAQMVAFTTILFDGVDNFLRATAFTLNQPTTIYALLKQVAVDAVIQERVFDGNTLNSGSVQITPTTSTLVLHAGTQTATNTDLTVNTYAVISSIFDGASSSLQVDNGTPTTGNPGAGNMGGFTLADWGNADGTRVAHIQVKEVIILSAAATADEKTRVIDYLLGVVN